MNRFLLLAVVAFLLQACATPQTTIPSPELLSAVQSNGSVVVVVNSASIFSCDETLIGIHQQGARQNDVVWTLRDTGYESSAPAMVIARPGKIRLSGASCLSAGYQPMRWASAGLWFGEIEVSAGEVIYLGALTAHREEFDAKTGTLTRAASAVASGTPSYLTFEFVDRSAEVLERLRVSHPTLAERLVVRIPPPFMTREDFVGALRVAYAPGSDGTPPTADQTRASLSEQLEIVRARAVLRSHGETVDTPQAPPATIH